LNSGIDGIEFSCDAATKQTYEKIRQGLSFEKLIENISYVRKLRDDLGSPTNLIVSFVEEDANRCERETAEAFWVPKYVDKIQFRVWLQYGKLGSVNVRRTLMHEREPCPYPFERINMDSQGGFHLCAFDIEHETNYGNINNDSVSEIWRCEEIDKVRRLLIERRFNDIPICSKCSDWGCRSWNHNFWSLCEDADSNRVRKE
jgi:radical SAM protein with 4Fe4S-binding SPASM domain